MILNPLAVAVHGLGYAAAIVALQGLLQYVADEVKKSDSESGGGLKTRRRIIGISPFYAPAQPVEEDEALILIGLI